MWYLGDYDGEFGLSYSYTSNLEIHQSVSYLYRTTKCSQYLRIIPIVFLVQHSDTFQRSF